MDMLARNWKWVALRGALAVAFGALTAFNPAITLTVLVLFYGGFTLADGVFTVFWTISNRRGEPHWVALLVGGIAGIGVGVITFLMPGVTALVLLYLIAAWAVITGVMQVIAAIRLRKVMTGEWLLALAGVLSVLFGLLLFAFPGAGALTVVIWIGAFAMVLGIVLLGLAVRLRAWDRVFGGSTKPPAA